METTRLAPHVAAAATSAPVAADPIETQFRAIDGAELQDPTVYYGADPKVAELLSNDDWSKVTTAKTELGPVEVFKKKIDGFLCLRSEVLAKGVTPKQVLTTVFDVESTPKWSTSGIGAGGTLRAVPGKVEFYQALKVPMWVPVKHKFWAATATTTRKAEGTWELLAKLGDDALHNEAQPRVKKEFGKAEKLQKMLGAWTVSPAEGGSFIRYAGGADVGISPPAMIENFIYGKMAPKSITGTVKEVKRRFPADA